MSRFLLEAVRSEENGPNVIIVADQRHTQQAPQLSVAVSVQINTICTSLDYDKCFAALQPTAVGFLSTAFGSGV
jgi:hypothetical protein